ncbi:MAG TPA: glycoside hydrolase family 2, partial [Dehalococcoidia bacterium]|nr:glycoside hydrolase family 2 [Dehalococcoidia bacterium]
MSLHEYPRPQLVREGWTSLDGTWQFAFDDDAQWHRPEQVGWQREIVVPFAPETPASGIGDTGFHPMCWYRRTFAAPALAGGERLVLHFGAVDYAARVWVNGALVATHEGGYTPFAADLTDHLVDGEQTVVVRVEDDPHDMAKPRGKQDWELAPHGIWYPRTTGIWQTVWIERVPA